MADYIELDKPIKIIDTRGRELTTTVLDILETNHAEYEKANVRPANIGRWLELDSCMTICSECNGLGCETPYCPNCGVKMKVTS